MHRSLKKLVPNIWKETAFCIHKKYRISFQIIARFVIGRTQVEHHLMTGSGCLSSTQCSHVHCLLGNSLEVEVLGQWVR